MIVFLPNATGTSSRDANAKVLFSRLFDWIIVEMNTSLACFHRAYNTYLRLYQDRDRYQQQLPVVDDAVNVIVRT